MDTKAIKNISKRTPATRPAINPEARENQLIALAVDLAERQLIEGTASAQVLVHYLKLATEKEKLERKKLEKETKLLEEKCLAIQSSQRSEELYTQALKAMRSYSGNDEDNEDENY